MGQCERLLELRNSLGLSFIHVQNSVTSSICLHTSANYLAQSHSSSLCCIKFDILFCLKDMSDRTPRRLICHHQLLVWYPNSGIVWKWSREKFSHVFCIMAVLIWRLTTRMFCVRKRVRIRWGFTSKFVTCVKKKSTRRQRKWKKDFCWHFDSANTLLVRSSFVDKLTGWDWWNPILRICINATRIFHYSHFSETCQSFQHFIECQVIFNLISER